MSGTCGPTSRTPLAFYDPDESCLRTWTVTDLLGPRPFSETLPRWGMWDGGVLYELPMPALPTVEPESSSLLPTPAVNDMGAGKTVEAWDEWTERMRARHGNGNGHGHGPSLSIEAQRLFPTPVADNSRGLPSEGTDYASLPNAVCSLLPTPRATDGEKGGPNQRGSSGDLMLPSAVQALLPTPTAGDAAAARNSTATRHKLPPTGIHAGNTLTDLVVPLPGEPTSLLSVAGSASPDDQHPDQLSLDATGSD